MLLVTGITGHSGKYFLKILDKNNYNKTIRCIVRKTSDTSLLDNSGLTVEKHYGDLNDEQSIKRAMIGVDEVLHIYNIHHSIKIVREAIKAKVKRIILVHTTGIYSNFKEASQEYKRIENQIFNLVSQHNYSNKITIIRPSMIYGDMCDNNMSKFIKLIDSFRIVPIVDNGKNLIQPVNARDLGNAYYQILKNSNKTLGKNYNITGESPLEMKTVLSIISKELNKKTLFINIPLSLGVLIGKIIRIMTFGKIDIVEKVQRMGENRSYSHEEAKLDFDYNPMSFEKGINLEIRDYLEEKNKK